MTIVATNILSALHEHIVNYPADLAAHPAALKSMRELIEPLALALEQPTHPQRANILDSLTDSMGSNAAMDLLLGSFLFDLTKDISAFRMALAGAKQIPLSPEAQYNIFIQLNYLLFINQAACSQAEYYRLRQFDLRNFYQEIFTHIQPLMPRVEPPDPKRLVIFINHMNNPRVLAPAWDALELAYTLCQEFEYEVLLVNGNFWLRASMMPVWPLRSYVKFNGPPRGFWPHRGLQIPYCTAPTPIPNSESVEFLDDIINDFNPAMGLAVGDSNIYADRFALHRPVATMHFTVDYPLTLNTILGLHPNTFKETADGASPLPKPRRCITLTENYSLQGRTHTYPRALLSLPLDAFVFIIIGHRLHSEITDDFLSMLSSVFAEAPNAHALFAGHFDRFDERMRAWPAMRSQSHFIGHVSDVMGLCAAGDVFLNPDRAGGGSSAVYALAAGLPVLTLPRGDVNFVVGAQKACADWKEMGTRSIRLALNPSDYKLEAKVALTRSRALLNRHNFARMVLLQMKEETHA